jgi:anti-sigma-K factor RskA
MNLKNLRRNELLLEKLASEYVLGTLRGGARRRFEGWMGQDPVVLQAVARWHDRLSPLAELTTPVQPPPQIWKNLEQQLHLGRQGKRRGFLQTLFDDLRFWRGLGLASTSVAAILLAVLLVRQPDAAFMEPSYIATLADDQTRVAALVAGHAGRGELTVTVLAQQDIGPERSLELWAVPPEGAPRSLGLVAAGGTITLPLPENTSPSNIALFAISLEPRGGSPNPAGPSGPILYKGPLLPVQG